MPPLQVRRLHEDEYPSTWNVATIVAGSLWFTYTIYSSALSIWTWLIHKLSTPPPDPNLVPPRKIPKTNLDKTFRAI
jgi:hypothetical protein